MAAGGKGGLKDLQQEVMCPLCLDTFEDPRVLPCQHVYCKSCLDHLASRGGNVSLACPECRKAPDLADGVAGLPIAFQINRLKEVVAKMTLEEEGEKEKVKRSVEPDGPTADVPARQGSVSSCGRHPGQPLDLYCRQCEELVCRDCILFGKMHASHTYNKVEEITREFRRDIRRELASLLQKQPALTDAVTDVRRAQQTLEESCGVIASKISESYDRVIGIVEEKRSNELRQFQSKADAKLTEMKTRETTLTRTLSEVKAVQSLVERGVERLGHAEFMARKKGMALKISQMHQRISSIPMSIPETSLHAQVPKSGSAEAIGLVLHPYKIVEPSLCTAAMAKGFGHIQVGVATTVSILLKDSEGHPCPLLQCVTMELHSPRFGDKLVTKVVAQSPSQYEACFTPTLGTRGHCQLTAKVNSHMIGSGPIKVFIGCPPQLLGEPVHFINDISSPGCLKIFNERMFCRTRSGIYIIDLNDTSAPPTHSALFPSIGQVSEWGASEMALDKERSVIYVSDAYNSMVHKFYIEGHHLRSTGRKGSGPGEFNRANGLCVSRDGTLYVCDSDNHRIQVFDQNLQFLRCFGSHGSGPGQFNWPDTIGFDSSGYLYTTDSKNHRVQCFTANGKFFRCIGKEGRGSGDFSNPNIIDIVASYIFVTDDGGVSVFTTGGQFISRFATMCSAVDGIPSDGLAVDQNGFVFVADYPRNRIVVF